MDPNHHRGADLSPDALELLYDEAVCVGGELSPWPAAEERLRSPIELLAQLTIHTPQLAFFVVQLDGAGETAPECLARQARRYWALAIRLAHRALEVMPATLATSSMPGGNARCSRPVQRFAPWTSSATS